MPPKPTRKKPPKKGRPNQEVWMALHRSHGKRIALLERLFVEWMGHDKPDMAMINAAVRALKGKT